MCNIYTGLKYNFGSLFSTQKRNQPQNVFEKNTHHSWKTVDSKTYWT